MAVPPPGLTSEEVPVTRIVTDVRLLPHITVNQQSDPLKGYSVVIIHGCQDVVKDLGQL